MSLRTPQDVDQGEAVGGPGCALGADLAVVAVQRAAHGDRLGAPAAGVRLRLRDDRLAQVARLAPGRGLGEAARVVARRVARRRSARVVARSGRLEVPAGEKGARKPVPARSTAAARAASTTSS